MVLTALVAEEAGIGQLVIVEAENGAEAAAELREVAAERYQPFLVEIPVSPASRGGPSRRAAAAWARWAR